VLCSSVWVNTDLFYETIQELLIGQRMMTISTVGVPNTIKRLAAHKLQSTLAIRYNNHWGIQSLPIWHSVVHFSFLVTILVEATDDKSLTWCFDEQFTCPKSGAAVTNSSKCERVSARRIDGRLQILFWNNWTASILWIHSSWWVTELVLTSVH
jgi:hypothetical protein